MVYNCTCFLIFLDSNPNAKKKKEKLTYAACQFMFFIIVQHLCCVSVSDLRIVLLTGKLGRAFWDGTQMVQVILRRERLFCEYRRE